MYNKNIHHQIKRELNVKKGKKINLYKVKQLSLIISYSTNIT